MPLDITYDYWIYNSSPTPGRMQVNINSIGTQSINNVYSLYNTGDVYTYSTNKNYQIETHVFGLYATSASFSVSPDWSDELLYVKGMTAKNYTFNGTQSYIHYSSPNSTIFSEGRVKYKANGTFSNTSPNNPGITDFKLNELDFNILGFSYYKETENSLDPTTNCSLGWYYDVSKDIYFWYDYISGSSSESITKSRGYFPVGGINNDKKSDIGYRLNNCLYKFIPYYNFNFTFRYYNTSSFPLKIYLSPTSPNLNPSSWNNLLTNTYTPPTGSVLLASLTQSYYGTFSSAEYYIPVEFYGVPGNKYLLFVGGFAGISSSSPTYSAIYLENMKISGEYHPGNNRQYLLNDNITYYSIDNITNATYSALIASGNSINSTQSLINPGISKIYSKIGNGSFKSGIWENGVWNSGYRYDKSMYEFYDIYESFTYNKSKRWRLQIIGPESSVSNFEIGDNVSVSNVVFIDINENRKLIKKYFTIIKKTDNSIILEFDTDFPIRRIEKDSEYHRIYVTKNIWLSGGFLNGYFTGIWNYGLFKGYPLLTEMYNSHWIDGVFDGGHFHSEKYVIPNFDDTLFQSGKVGLTFSTPHGLYEGDIIIINKTNKTINPQYDGEHKVTSIVNDYQIITDIDWGYNSNNESGSIISVLSKGLIQKIDFKSNNISKITSENSLDSNSVFLYNSWMDIVYDNSSATNIGKPQYMLNDYSKKTYSENNLYGYISNDILESNSSFRDSFSNTIRKYKLGTKYKIFNDYIGDAGNFDYPFGSTISNNIYDFIKYGWTFSKIDTGSITFSRTDIDQSFNSVIGEEMKVSTTKYGGILDITSDTESVDINKTYQDIEKLRYTKIEFDLVTYSNNLSISTYDNRSNLTQRTSSTEHTPYVFKYKGINIPNIHFNNLNIIKRDNLKEDSMMYATYLPIYENVNHLKTKNSKKIEYFYNKRNLALHFHGYSTTSNLKIEYVLDNLHFYEIDMIPFFSYFTDDNINKSITIPYQGISPFIDYNNYNFNFIDSISIGLDSIETIGSYTIFSGVGNGIGIVGTQSSHTTNDRTIFN